MSSGSKTALVLLAGYGLVGAAAGIALTVPDPAAVASSARTSSTIAAGQVVDVVPSPVRANPSVPPPPPATGGGPDSSPLPTALRDVPAPGETASFEPARMVLPDGTPTAVLSVGVGDDGGLVIPENPAQVGRWVGGARAADSQGSLVIAGHVDSRDYGLGALYRLKGVTPGSVIELQGETRRQRYIVTSTRQVSQQSLATDDQFFRQDTPHRLVVITCGGPFDAVRHRYRDNYIVLARPA